MMELILEGTIDLSQLYEPSEEKKVADALKEQRNEE